MVHLQSSMHLTMICKQKIKSKSLIMFTITLTKIKKAFLKRWVFNLFLKQIIPFTLINQGNKFWTLTVQPAKPWTLSDHTWEMANPWNIIRDNLTRKEDRGSKL